MQSNRPGGPPLPALNDPRQEAFARARAQGASLRAASDAGGFTWNLLQSQRRAVKLAARIDELEFDGHWRGETEASKLFEALIEMAAIARGKAGEENLKLAGDLLAKAATVRAAVFARGEARTAGPSDPPVRQAVAPALTTEQWMAAFGPRD